MKIYTRTGDTGTTALFGGDRVAKSHPRIEAYGTVDETNSIIGLVRAHLGQHSGNKQLNATLARVQNELFVLGADLATPQSSRATVPRIESAHVEQLETDIDAYVADLPPLEHFILPGGVPAAATLHLARTVCRRAERLTVEAAKEEQLGKQTIMYLNRLSDLLFILARWANFNADIAESEWQTGGT